MHDKQKKTNEKDLPNPLHAEKLFFAGRVNECCTSTISGAVFRIDPTADRGFRSPFWGRLRIDSDSRASRYPNNMFQRWDSEGRGSMVVPTRMRFWVAPIPARVFCFRGMDFS